MKKTRFAQIICMLVCISILLSYPAEARLLQNANPFKKLKVGSMDLKKVANESLMLTDSYWDGVPDTFLSEWNLTGYAKAGSKIKFKLKKGYSAKIYLYYYRNGKLKKQRLKNGSKLKAWDCGECFIRMLVKKGRFKSYLVIYYDEPDYDYDDDE